MVVVDICGISVDFPFEPYDVQKRYMEKVFECLQFNVNGVLESPTGTGKTLSLLCICLAYLEDFRNKQQKQKVSNGFHASDADTNSFQGEPKIIYAMRTHSQVSHAFNELHRTGYKNIKATVIGSRNQLCLDSEVNNESNKNIKINLCRAKVNARKCHYYNNVESTVASIREQKLAVDIEDLINTGKKNQCCPYYLSRTMTRDSSVIFMPYNYLIDAKSRKHLDVNITGNIVIFDEAHNVEQLCENAASSELRSRDIAVAISETTFIMQDMATRSAETSSSQGGLNAFDESDLKSDFTLNEVCCIKSFLCELECQLDAIAVSSEEGLALTGPEIFKIFEKSGVTKENQTQIVSVIDKLVVHLSNASKIVGMRKGGSLQKCSEMITMFFKTNLNNEAVLLRDASSYKIYLTLDDAKKSNDVWSIAKQNSWPKVLHLWCFNPGISMRQLLLEGPKCMIFTSGTLSPIESFVSELQIPIPVQLENPHIIQKSQLYASIIYKGPDNVPLNSSYRTRSNLNYILSLGKTIVNFIRVVPRGVLVFFPSYYMMKECHKQWEDHGVWHTLGTIKQIFVESQGQDIHQLIEEYYAKNREPGGRGAIMMAVCRGKVSEGIDFADDNGRCVILTGLPFRPWKDPKVVGKMNYLDSQLAKKAVSFGGRSWYDLEGIRAVNQAIGRVIRHKDDYATILLCDERFGQHKVQSYLSSWLKPYLNTTSSFGFGLRDVVRFFKPKLQADSGEDIIKLPTMKLAAKASEQPTTSLVQNSPLKENEICSDQLINNLFDYASTNQQIVPVSSSKKSTTSLITALQCDSPSPKSFIRQSTSTSTLVRPLSPPSFEVRKKKLRVLGPQKSYEMAAAESSQNQIKNNEPLTSEKLLKTLKLLLTSDQYKTFAKGIKEFHADHDMAKICSTLISLCTSKDIYTTLLGFSCLIPEKNRANFKMSFMKQWAEIPKT